MKKFTLLFLAGYLFIGLCVFYSVAIFDLRALTCRADDSQKTLFMAICNHGAFGDYEHGAYLHNLEDTNQYIEAADILFLGNSRMQFALHETSLNEFFGPKGVSYYALGFGYDEGDAFIKLLQDTYQWSPKALIINADPFFSRVSDVAKDIFDNQKTKAVFQKQTAFLNVFEKLPKNPLQNAASIHRDPKNGLWHWQHSMNFSQSPQNTDAITGKEIALTQNHLKAYQAFIRSFNIEPVCVLITHIPNHQIDAASFGLDLEKQTGSPFISVDQTSLQLLDGSHLTAKSARLWSERFLNQAEPYLADCLKKG